MLQLVDSRSTANIVTTFNRELSPKWRMSHKFYPQTALHIYCCHAKGFKLPFSIQFWVIPVVRSHTPEFHAMLVWDDTIEEDGLPAVCVGAYAPTWEETGKKICQRFITDWIKSEELGDKRALFEEVFFPFLNAYKTTFPQFAKA